MLRTCEHCSGKARCFGFLHCGDGFVENIGLELCPDFAPGPSTDRTEFFNDDVRPLEDIEVEMPTVPNQECRETLDSLLPLIGLPIVSGFTNRVKDLVGGTRGCAHLIALITAMAPAAVQGAWAAMTSKPQDPAEILPGAVERIKDTCRIWRSDGPLVKEIEKQNPS